ncbi:MAG: CRISPR-associated endonuclease Cas2 [Anaerolineales bacterium]
MRSFYLLTYDVPDNKRRLKLAKALEALGERVQYSVFEAYLTDKELEKLLKQVQKLLNESEDNLRVYVLCGQCRGKVFTYGNGKITEPPGLMIV